MEHSTGFRQVSASAPLCGGSHCFGFGLRDRYNGLDWIVEWIGMEWNGIESNPNPNLVYVLVYHIRDSRSVAAPACRTAREQFSASSTKVSSYSQRTRERAFSLVLPPPGFQFYSTFLCSTFTWVSNRSPFAESEALALFDLRSSSIRSVRDIRASLNS